MAEQKHGQSSGMVPEDVVNQVTSIVASVQQALVLLRNEIEQQRQWDQADRQTDRELRKNSAEYIQREMENLLAGQQAMVANQQQLLDLATDGAARLGKLEEGQAAHATQLNTLSEQMDEQRQTLANYMAGSKREDFEARITRLEQKTAGPELSADQRQRYIDILMRMIAEYEAAHPDETGHGVG